MPYDINVTFEDYNLPHRRGSILLNIDQLIGPVHFTYPLTYTGLISGHPVRILQTGPGTTLISDFTFEVWPENYENEKRDAVNAIDSYVDGMMN